MSRPHRVLAMIAAILGLGAAATGFHPGANVTELALEIEAERDHISALQLAEKIIAREPGLRILDLRPEEQYREFHIPTAAHASLKELARLPVSGNGATVLYSEGGALSAQAWVLLRMRGYRNVFVLREGIYEWISRVHEPRLAADATAAEWAEFTRAAEFSRYFGGVPLSGVPRSEVPTGYWTGMQNAQPAARDAVARIRRRGC